VSECERKEKMGTKIVIAHHSEMGNSFAGIFVQAERGKYPFGIVHIDFLRDVNEDVYNKLQTTNEPVEVEIRLKDENNN